MQIKTKIVSCQRADSKPVKQEDIHTVILPPLVFPGLPRGRTGAFLPEAGRDTGVSCIAPPSQTVGSLEFNKKNQPKAHDGMKSFESAACII